MLLREPVRFHAPFGLIRSPLDFKLAHELWYQFSHFHDGDILANAGSVSVSELGQDPVSQYGFQSRRKQDNGYIQSYYSGPLP